MPFDIVRQGILASLTGGWATFEPAHSLFCNTLHLYVWMTLFALPILLGIILTNSGTEQYGYGIALGYLIVISIIFIIIKSVILWLHHIFDTIQPIKYKSKTAILNSVEEQTAQQRPYRTGRFSGSSFSATRATESNAIDMIEMFDIHRPRSELQENIHSEERSTINQDINKINGQHIEGHNKLSDRKSQQFLPLSRNTREILHGSAVDDESDSSSSSSSTSKCSAYGLLNSNEASCSKQIRGAILPTADSMDLLPVRRRSKTRLTFKERNKKLSRCHQKQRKYSEPSNLVCSTSNGFGSIGREWRKPLNRKKSEERRPYAIRRFNSTSTTIDTEFGNGKKSKFASLILPKTGSLGTHFPGGILVDELELNRWSLTSNNRSSKYKHQTAIKDEKEDILAEEQVNKIDGIYTSKNKEHNYDDDEACTSHFSPNNGNIIIEKEFENQPSTSQFSSFELNQPSTSTATIPSEKDLKGQITKFLEEMIEKHPDTLMDAIESVRINRLYQQIGARQQNRDDDESILQSQKNQLMVPSHQHKPHVALDAADTSQGAVHTFQDESGNWFTYSFGSHSSGTAQPLITANEMFRDRRHRNQNRHLVRIEQPEPSTHLGLPITATVVLERSSSNIGVLSKKRTNETVEQENNIEENPHYPTNVNVVNRKRSCSSSSFSSIGEAAKIAGNVISIPISRSSSSDSATHHYLPHAPTNVFRADTVGNGRTTIENDNDERTIASLSMRSQNNNRQLSESSRQLIAAFMQRICQGTTENPEFRSRIMIPSGRRQQRVRTDSDIGDIRNQGQTIAGTPSPGSPSVNMNTVRLLNDLQMNRTLPPPFLFNFSRTDPNRTRLKYYYKLKIPLWMLRWWPFGGKVKSDEQGEENSQREFKLKIDRLSLASLFDRNFSIISSIFDVFLALLIGILTVSVFSRGIYTQLSLLAFAFVVAASQFSLLKSVQPDASSPVHGFNYLVAYSRPIYFIILAIILLTLDWVFPTLYPEFKLTLAWQPSWLRIYSNPNIIISPRDICAHALLWLPIAFTIGLLPQINTLVMHLSEQIDMHIFGGTASLTLFSALFSLARSVVTTGMLIGLLRFIEHLWPFQTSATIAFSALIAFTSSMAFLLSRTSTNPLFIQLVLKEFWKSLKRREDNQMEKIKKQPKNSQLNSSITTLTAPSNKQQQLLRCCIFGSTQNYNTQQQQHESSNPNRKEDNVHEQPRRIGMDGKRIIEQQRKENELISGISIHTLLLRSHHDIFSCFMRLIIIFAIHCTSLFRTGQPYFEQILAFLAVLFGVLNHHIYPQLRAKYPWKLFSQPFLRPFDFNKFEMVVEAKMTLFEKIHAVMICIEKDILYPMLFASLMSTTGIWWNTSLFLDSLLLVCAFRLIRTGFAQPQQLYIPLFFTCLIQFDRLGHIEEIPNANFLRSSPLLCLFLLTIFWSKLIELLLKLHFILCYIAPWQISWGSAFHAFAQPFSVPHSGLMLAQAIISSIISAPLNPFLGSSFFLMSYIRPVKFWERDYNTKRIDHSKLRLASQLDRGPMVDDDSNLNSIFYEHLTRSLQKWLAGDLLLGRWACSIRPGDCFILASNYLNCMVQLVEIGNGFVTFQLRGLEFRGTYCHQREMEAISEDWADSNGACCCCSLGRIPGLISFNNAWTLRWLAWEVTVAKYVVDGYSISDNSAVNMLQVHELRRLLVTLYVKCMIYYAVNSFQFEIWLSDETILKSLEPILQNQRYIEHDSVFCAANDEDYDLNFSGLSRQSFVFFYGDWIEHCMLSRSTPLAINALKNGSAVGNGSPLFQLVSSFSFALSILGRRALGTAAYNRHANAAESFLFGMHALFKGDMRITHPSDEWVFTDPEILSVISPSVRMALKLHQDNFAAIVDLDEPAELYERINSYKEKIFISHEHDPAWRKAILANTPSLLALRHICEDGQDDYKVIMLNKRHLDMRVIKLNRECVRAFWAGQQQELIFLRNKNPERGSIQNARQVLRNMINSSADQPIGYPIYVSPLVTSFIESHPQMEQVLGPTLTFNWFWQALCSLFSRLRNHFGTSGSSTSAHHHSIPMATFSNTIPPSRASGPPPIPPHQSSNDKKEETIEVGDCSATNFPLTVEKKSTLVNSQMKYSEKEKERRQNSISHSHLGVETAHSQTNDLEHIRRNSATDFSTIIGGILDLKEVADERRIYGTMIIQDTNKILPRLNEPLRSGECLVQWPSNGHWLSRGGAKAWPPDWRNCFHEGRVVHRWSPFHPDQTFRSHAGQIYLLEIENNDGDNWFVPIMEEGIRQKNKDENDSDAQ